MVSDQFETELCLCSKCDFFRNYTDADSQFCDILLVFVHNSLVVTDHLSDVEFHEVVLYYVC